MAKKPKHHAAPLTATELRQRIERAEQEGRFQYGLELARQLVKQEPSPVHQELLRRMTLGRARQLRRLGATRDAAVVLRNALQLASNDAAFLEQISAELAACGQTQEALDVLNRIPGSSAKGRVLTQAADTAVTQGPAGRNALPPDLQGQFDLVLQAFAQAEAGADEAARTTLQGLGLQSPFLEWKLFLRGLLAYYQRDDVRAIENWQRLDPARPPARLAAPLRFRIDPAFRQAQPPETQAQLQKKADQLQSPGLVQMLRTIQAALANPNQLPQAFRHADQVLASLRQQAPHLAPRLATCYYWAVIHHGEPEDVRRYQRVFGAPADDPRLARLRALMGEHIGDLEMAHRAWQEFEQSIADNPAAWPGDLAARARALVWEHMGHNAESVPPEEALDLLPPFLRDSPLRPRPLKPSAEECYKRSLELTPEQLEAHEALFRHYLNQEADRKATAAAKALLKHFPEHVPTLQAYGDLCLRHDRHAEAIELFQRALRANPLDRSLRTKLGTAHLFQARKQAEAGRFDEARAGYQAALALSEHQKNSSIYCKMAACEFKAGDTARAEELLQKALAEDDNYLSVMFSMLIEVIRLKLPRTLKNRFDSEIKRGLEEPPTAARAEALLNTVSSHALAGITYFGQKTHEKKVFAYLDQARTVPFTEEQLKSVCQSLGCLKSLRRLLTFAQMGQQRFPNNPWFYFLEAEGYISQGPYRCPVDRAWQLLDRARQLAEKMPRDTEQQELLRVIQERQNLLGPIHQGRLPFGTLLDQFVDLFDGADDDEGW